MAARTPVRAQPTLTKAASNYNVMCFKVPFRWTDANLREAFETIGPTLSAELFRPKEGEQGFDTTRHKGFGKVAFQHPSSVEALFADALCKILFYTQTS